MEISLLIFFVGVLNLISGYELEVQTKNGKIRGRIQTTISGQSYRAWQGIPFGKPPVGNLRFQAPQAADNWSGVKVTTKESNICYQVKSDSDAENEDCLYVNVFAPDTVGSEKLPVMFWIYGGAFRQGSANFYSTGPDRLIQEGVIVVTFNYRVGPFGFLSTGDTVVPGNAGLKDQALALKWTHDNIAAFGGDPNKITIFGESAGSASVGYQLLSPLSKGLFKGAIQQSGSPLNDWASRINPKAFVEDLIKIVDPEANVGTDSVNQLNYLQSVDAKKIDLASKTTADLALPVIEPAHTGAFLTETMYESFESGYFNWVPLMIGFNSEEDIFMAHSNKYIIDTGRAFDKNLESLVPQRMNTDANRNEIGQEIKAIYLEDNELFASNEAAVVKFSSDSGFNRGILKEAELISKHEPVYFYKFSYDGELGGWSAVLPGAENVTHGEDLYYLWVHRGAHSNEDLSKYPEADRMTSQRMVKMWTNFAKYRNPTPETSSLLQNVTWPALRENRRHYLDIGIDLQVKTEPKPTYPKWTSIYEKYAKKPYNTY